MNGQTLIGMRQAQSWCAALLEKCGQTPENAATVAEILVNANLRGVDSHGIIMMRHYVRRFTRIKTRPIRIVSETETNAVVDGGDNMGMVTAVTAMEKAIEKAGNKGAGVVTVRNSNHFGAAAYYALMAPPEDMIGIAMTNAGKRLAPWGGLDCILGNNPFAIAVPGIRFPVVLDMANSTVAFQKVAQYAREGLPLPDGWSMDAEGNPTNDAQEALTGILMPVGGYKGVGLTVMVDILSGILSQNGLSEQVVDVDEYDKTRRIGHCFMAIRIADFVSPAKFKKDVDEFADRFHSVRKKKGVEKIYMPGEVEFYREQERREKGFPISSGDLKQLDGLSLEFGVSKLSEIS